MIRKTRTFQIFGGCILLIGVLALAWLRARTHDMAELRAEAETGNGQEAQAQPNRIASEANAAPLPSSPIESEQSERVADGTLQSSDHQSFLRVKFKTIDEFDNPLPECIVQLQSASNQMGADRVNTYVQKAGRFEGVRLAEAVSDAEGLCVVELPAETRVAMASASSNDKRTSGWIRARFYEANDEVVTLRLFPTLKLRGRVLDTVSRPIADALVQLGMQGITIGGAVPRLPEPIKSLKDGSFEVTIDGVPATIELKAVLNHQESLPAIVHTRSPPSGEITLTIPLNPNDAFAIQGVISDPEGRPVAGASVTVIGISYYYASQTPTDGHGWFREVVAQPGEFFVLAVSESGSVSHPLVVSLEDSQSTIEVAMLIEPWQRIQGRAMWSTGQPASGVSIVVVPTTSIDLPGLTVSSNLKDVLGVQHSVAEADGSFTIENTPAGCLVSVYAFPEDRPDIAVELTNVLPDASNLLLTIDATLLAGGEATVIVREGGSSEPVVGYEVVLYQKSPSGTWFQVNSEFADSEDGRHFIKSLTKGREYCASVQTPACDRALVGPWLAIGTTEDFQVRVCSDGALAVRPKHANGSMAVGWACTAIEVGDVPPRRMLSKPTSGTENLAVLKPLRAGRYRVTAEKAGFPPSVIETEVMAGQMVTVDITVPDG